MSQDEVDSLNGAGHLCFECVRLISVEDVRTVTYLANMPIYHHTSCLKGEDKTQAIVEHSKITGNMFHKEML